MKSVAEMTCREYVESMKHPDPWKLRDEFTLYLHAGSRLKVQAEYTDTFIELSRDDELAEAGIYTADQDSKEFADDFVKRFCDNLSLHQLNDLVTVVTEARDKWQAEHAASNS